MTADRALSPQLQLASIIKTLPTELIKAIHEALNQRVVITPISQRVNQPKRLSTKRREEAPSRRDYDFEMGQEAKMWDNPKGGPGAEVGGIFCFLHLTEDINTNATHLKEGRVEIHKVESIWPAEYGRPHWENPRDALYLSNKLGELTFKQFKALVVGGSGEPWKQSFKRVAGTMRTRWNPQLDFIIRQELAQRDHEPSLMKARIWTKQQFPLDHSILEVCQLHANNAGFYPNEIEGAAITIQMLLDEKSHRRGICGADIQSGKTGIQVIVAAAFRQIAVACGHLPVNSKLGVIHVLNISDKGIKSQIQGNLHSGFTRKFRSVRGVRKQIFRCESDNSTFLYLDMLSGGAEERIKDAVETLGEIGCTHFLIISDETQSAINPLQQFGSLLKSHFQITPQTIGETSWLLGVTATPSRFYAPLSDGLPITLCWVNHGESYYGLKKLLDDNRIQQIPVFKSIEHIKLLFLVSMEGQVDKYLLIRVNPTACLIDQPEVRVEVGVIQALRELEYEYEEFNSKNDNISELVGALSKPPSLTYVNSTNKRAIIIKGAARAGITFPTVEYIGAAFDAYKGFDAVVQSLAGRFCGYQLDRNNGPVIYTQKHLIDSYLLDKEAISGGKVPTPRGNRATASNNLGFAGKPMIVCVDPTTIEGSSILSQHAAHLRTLGAKQMHHALTENQRNHAKDIIDGKWTQPQRYFTLGVGPHWSPATEALLKQYPKLRDGWVLLAMNAEVIEKRPLPNTALNQCLKGTR